MVGQIPRGGEKSFLCVRSLGRVTPVRLATAKRGMGSGPPGASSVARRLGRRAHAMRPYRRVVMRGMAHRNRAMGCGDRGMANGSRATRTGGSSKQHPYDDGGIARRGDVHRRVSTRPRPVVGPRTPASAGSPLPFPPRAAVGAHGMCPPPQPRRDAKQTLCPAVATIRGAASPWIGMVGLGVVSRRG